MTKRLIPDGVREFIAENLDSIAELEALLLFRRESNATWSVAALAERLYASTEQTEEAIAKLFSLGLVVVHETDPLTYVYQPSSPEADTMVSDIAETYSKYLVPVTNLIHSKPRSRVQQFADAFKLRKKEDK